MKFYTHHIPPTEDNFSEFTAIVSHQSCEQKI